jgi:hypothetical protein
MVTWRPRVIIGIWLAAIVLAVGVVRFGDYLRATQGQAAGFYVGSLFIWMIWAAWIITWRWVAAREKASPNPWQRGMRGVLVFLGVLLLLLTLLEYARRICLTDQLLARAAGAPYPRTRTKSTARPHPNGSPSGSTAAPKPPSRTQRSERSPS